MTRLYIALATFDLLVLALLVRMTIKWWKVAILIALAVSVNIALLFAVPDTSGQAREGSLPQARLVACYVEEPNAIYFWLLENSEPISYRQPYSRELHLTCQTAMNALARGVVVGIKKITVNSQRRGEEDPRGRYVPYVLPPLGQAKE